MIDIQLLKTKLDPEKYQRTYRVVKDLAVYQNYELLTEIHIPLYVNNLDLLPNIIEFELRPNLIKILNNIQDNGKPLIVKKLIKELQDFHWNYIVKRKWG